MNDDEPAHQPLPRLDRVLAQPARALLRPPAPQHRLHHRVLRPQLHHPVDQLELAAPAKPIRRNATPIFK